MRDITTTVRWSGGVPVYRYRTAPDATPVSLLRLDEGRHIEQSHRHIHEFPVLFYVAEALPGPAGRAPLAAGDVFVIAAGEVIDPAVLETVVSCFGVFFDPSAVGGDEHGPWSSWRAHPLLFPFLHGTPGGLLRLAIPPQRRPVWLSALASIEAELAGRQDGYRQAALAHLTVLLVDIARLAADVVGDLRRGNEPLLAAVFEVIERRFAEPISLRDIGADVGLSPGHLTTLVRRRTGRTVLDWLTERRMSAARRLLTETSLPINEIARRVGLPDPAYFARVFRRYNELTPRAWRAAAGPDAR
ncbi:AraC family transcriptional regulator [Nocardia yunnanensis]|uniref:AraC family transcriptional regulator n=1 Tax=Nocardia yunnanensis TaxID=2382165 RepID=A0A386ZJ54_9NOCA|nr:AraC family transcriptional regulator [Nocardia yunnanensis]AYF77518.1 AraC family transcriptional regulator [Nocardia yunnanensis]